MNKILVTGGSGFIGSYVVENLLAREKEVIVLDIQKPSIDGIRYEEGSITDESLVDRLVDECDGVIHLGGLLGTSERIAQARLMSRINILGGLYILNSCTRRKKKAVIISTGNYWMNNCYAITKRAVAKFALMHNKEFGAEIAIVRGMNAYGPRQKAWPIRKIVPNFVIPALMGKPLRVVGSGNQVADLIYVGDIAEILTRALLMDHGVYDSIFEAGMGQNITVGEIAKLVIDLSRSDSEIQYVEKRKGEEFDAIVKADTKTLKPLGYSEVDMVSLIEGIDLTINWYRQTMTEYPGLLEKAFN